jgi:glycosyltransferase involved in cell wall biosynthesis
LKTKLSILTACFNEEKTISTLLQAIATVELLPNIEKEIIVIDDASTDRSYTVVQEFIAASPGINCTLLQQPNNKGKGACIRWGIEKAIGDIIIVQDADLEYDPSDYNKLILPILNGHADVVYGSRFRGSEAHRVLFFFHTLGNQLLTFLSNIFTQLNLTDMETGYKAFTASVLKKISLKENRFGFEPEITAKISRVPNIRIYEVGIAYHGRTFEEGKKINWKDGVRAIYCIIKYNIFVKK